MVWLLSRFFQSELHFWFTELNTQLFFCIWCDTQRLSAVCSRIHNSRSLHVLTKRIKSLPDAYQVQPGGRVCAVALIRAVKLISYLLSWSCCEVLDASGNRAVMRGDTSWNVYEIRVNFWCYITGRRLSSGLN